MRMIRQAARLAVVPCAVLCFARSLPGQQATTPDSISIDSVATAAGVPAAAQPQPANAASASALGPGDAVKIVVHRHPDLSGEFIVDENGDLVVPLVGSINVLGKPSEALKEELVRGLATYVRSPSVQVTPVYRITVMGEVRQPGLYPVDLTMTLPDVIALAGGIAPSGAPDKVKLLRGGRVTTWDLGSTDAQARSLAEIGLRSGDQIVVEERSKGFWQSAPVIASVVVSVVTAVVLVTN